MVGVSGDTGSAGVVEAAVTFPLCGESDSRPVVRVWGSLERRRHRRAVGPSVTVDQTSGPLHVLSRGAGRNPSGQVQGRGVLFTYSKVLRQIQCVLLGINLDAPTDLNDVIN